MTDGLKKAGNGESQMGKTTSHNEYINAKNGKCKVFITPSVSVSHEWLVDREGKKILGWAPGGGQ